MAAPQDNVMVSSANDASRAAPPALNATIGVAGHPSVQVSAAADLSLLMLLALMAGLIVAGLAVWALILAIRRTR